MFVTVKDILERRMSFCFTFKALSIGHTMKHNCDDKVVYIHFAALDRIRSSKEV